MIYYSKRDMKNISDVTLNADRKAYYEFQVEQKEPVLFCGCNGTGIPMILTAHFPTPHLQTKRKNDRSKHYKFCPHFIGDSIAGKYEPAITKSEDGTENAHVSFNTDEHQLEDRIDEEYRIRNQFIYNHRCAVHRGIMTFDAFVKYKNQQYFRINQYTKKISDPTQYTKNLWAFINHSHVNQKPLKDLSRGNFIYSIIKSIDYNKAKTHCRIQTLSGIVYTIKVDIVSQAIKKFKKTYNNLDFEAQLTAKDRYVIMYGFKDASKTKYPKYNDIGFILVNKYGLFSESLNEVKMYNTVCDMIFNKPDSKCIFYKPTEPENTYDDTNFISDGIIRSKENSEIIAVVEVFGRTENEYLERKHTKERTCKYPKVFWDVFENTSFESCVNALTSLLL